MLICSIYLAVHRPPEGRLLEVDISWSNIHVHLVKIYAEFVLDNVGVPFAALFSLNHDLNIACLCLFQFTVRKKYSSSTSSFRRNQCLCLRDTVLNIYLRISKSKCHICLLLCIVAVCCSCYIGPTQVSGSLPII